MLLFPSSQGGVMVLQLINPAAGRIECTQYRLGGGKEGWYPSSEDSSPAVLSCVFACKRELLFAMTQTQVWDTVLSLFLRGLLPLSSLESRLRELLSPSRPPGFQKAFAARTLSLSSRNGPSQPRGSAGRGFRHGAPWPRSLFLPPQPHGKVPAAAGDPPADLRRREPQR